MGHLKKTFIKKISSAVIILFVISHGLVAQNNLSVDACTTTEEAIALVDSVLLGNVADEFKKNITVTGAPGAIGYYTDGDIFNFATTTGIVLSSGYVYNLDRPNTCLGGISTVTGGGSDADLVQMSGQPVHDAIVIEFDLMMVNDSVYLSYLFGSEEYHEWVNTQWNDIFGFFLSGPGINGTFSNNAINIAVVPGTTNPVSVSTINCGNASEGCNPLLPGGNSCEYLVDNLQMNSESFNQLALDGYTVPLITTNAVNTYAWYHLKLTIGDTGDGYYDSGVFLEKGSIINIPTSDLMVLESKSNEEIIALIDTVFLSNINQENKANITYTGDSRAVGYFSNGELFGFDSPEGVVLTNGRAAYLNGANDCSVALSTQNFGQSDEDLELLSGQTIYKAAVIEFDLKFDADSVSFNGVFGSEDYHDLVDSDLADPVGIFVSGPGIEGPFSNSSVNVALVPGTNLPINAINLNCGFAPKDCDPDLAGGPHCDLLVNNMNTSGVGFNQFPLDGYTLPLTTGFSFISGEWYHVKIAIGNAGQASYDSGMFFEKGITVFDSLYVTVHESSTKDMIHLIPNPAKTYVEIQNLTNESIKQIKIFDLNGKILYHDLYDETKISLSGMPKGILVVELSTERQVIRKKLIHN